MGFLSACRAVVPAGVSVQVSPSPVPAAPSSASLTQRDTPPAYSVSSDAAITPAVATVLAFRHIFLIVMENKEYDQVIGSPDAPYLNQLATRYAVAERYYAIRHPSLPNYLALFGGQTFGVKSDCIDCYTDAPSLVAQLEARGKSWKSYQEDLPRPCFLGAEAGGYVLKHNPFLYFQDIRSSPARCERILPLTQFDADLASGAAPNFVWITPNVRHDMHDGSVAEGDRWLADVVPRILASDAWREDGLLMITWDEGTSSAGCCVLATGGRVATLVIAARGKRGYRSTVPATHYSLLRTIEDAWGLEYLGHSGDPGVRPLLDFFR